MLSAVRPNRTSRVWVEPDPAMILHPRPLPPAGRRVYHRGPDAGLRSVSGNLGGDQKAVTRVWRRLDIINAFWQPLRPRDRRPGRAARRAHKIALVVVNGERYTVRDDKIVSIRFPRETSAGTGGVGNQRALRRARALYRSNNDLGAGGIGDQRAKGADHGWTTGAQRIGAQIALGAVHANEEPLVTGGDQKAVVGRNRPG